MTILEFMGEHPILAFFLACILSGIVKFCVNRTMRTIKVLARGWPPAHLDADGDWPPTTDKED